MLSLTFQPTHIMPSYRSYLVNDTLKNLFFTEISSTIYQSQKDIQALSTLLIPHCTHHPEGDETALSTLCMQSQVYRSAHTLISDFASQLIHNTLPSLCEHNVSVSKTANGLSLYVYQQSWGHLENESMDAPVLRVYNTDGERCTLNERQWSDLSTHFHQHTHPAHCLKHLRLSDSSTLLVPWMCWRATFNLDDAGVCTLDVLQVDCLEKSLCSVTNDYFTCLKHKPQHKSTQHAPLYTTYSQVVAAAVHKEYTRTQRLNTGHEAQHARVVENVAHIKQVHAYKLRTTHHANKPCAKDAVDDKKQKHAYKLRPSHHTESAGSIATLAQHVYNLRSVKQLQQTQDTACVSHKELEYTQNVQSTQHSETHATKPPAFYHPPKHSNSPKPYTYAARIASLYMQIKLNLLLKPPYNHIYASTLPKRARNMCKHKYIQISDWIDNTKVQLTDLTTKLIAYCNKHVIKPQIETITIVKNSFVIPILKRSLKLTSLFMHYTRGSYLWLKIAPYLAASLILISLSRVDIGVCVLLWALCKHFFPTQTLEHLAQTKPHSPPTAAVATKSTEKHHESLHLNTVAASRNPYDPLDLFSRKLP